MKAQMDNNKKENFHSEFEKVWRKRFEYFASTHDDDAGIAGWSQTGLQVRLRGFLRAWNPENTGKYWLDAGCGAGTYSRNIHDAGKDVVGVDYSYPTIEKAKTKLDSAVLLAVTDVTMLPFNKGVFDGAMCFGVMQALETPLPALMNLRRVVQPLGEVWVDSLNKWCLPNIWTRVKHYVKKQPMHLRYYSPAEVKKFAQDSGLNDIKLYWLPILPYRLRKLQWLIETNFALWLINNVPLFGLLISHSFILKGKVSQDSNA